MAVFYLCRHGQTENNKNKRFSGWIDTPLTDKGIEDTGATASRLHGIHFDYVYSSDLGRAFISAYLIARHIGFTNEIQRSKQLREVSYGDTGNMLVAEAQAIYPGLDTDTNFIAPGGESLGQMQQRALQYMSMLNRQYPDSTILIVAHGGIIDAACANFKNVDLGQHMATAGVGSRHDFVAKFTLSDTKITTFEEIL